MIHIKCRGLAGDYGYLVERVQAEGALTDPRGLTCHELRPVLIESSEPRSCMMAGKDLNYRFALAEYMAMLCGWDDVEWLARFMPSIRNFAEDDGHFHGGYGVRMNNPRSFVQIGKLLTRAPDSRQAVINLWDIRLAIPAKKKDHPCNTQVYFKVRDGYLDVTVFRRSADVIWGVPYDHFVFGMLLCHMARLLHVKEGVLREYIDSLHLYAADAGFYNVARIERAKQTLTIPQFIDFDWLLDPARMGILRMSIEQPEVMVVGEDGVAAFKFLTRT